MKSVLKIDDIKFTLFLNNNGSGHFEQYTALCITKTRLFKYIENVTSKN